MTYPYGDTQDGTGEDVNGIVQWCHSFQVLIIYRGAINPSCRCEKRKECREKHGREAILVPGEK